MNSELKHIQKLYQEALTKDSLRLGIPKQCLGSCSFYSDSDFSWKKQKEFARFYNLDLLIAKVTRWAKKLEGMPILALDHSGDPSYDSSGITVKTDCTIDFKKISTIEELCWLYNGNSYASYESGCGLFHETYGYDVRDTIEEFVCNPFNISDKEMFKKMHFSLEDMDEDKKDEFIEIVTDSVVSGYIEENIIWKIKLP